jgi:hypothetical protein
MLPSYHTLETVTRARIEDIVQETEQRRLAQQIYECSEIEQQTADDSNPSWFQRLALRISGTRA